MNSTAIVQRRPNRSIIRKVMNKPDKKIEITTRPLGLNHKCFQCDLYMLNSPKICKYTK